MDTFFAGNGTDGLSFDTAYVLEDFEIDAGGVGSAIRLANTNRYLVITKCNIKGEQNLQLEKLEDLFMVLRMFS